MIVFTFFFFFWEMGVEYTIYYILYTLHLMEVLGDANVGPSLLDLFWCLIFSLLHFSQVLTVLTALLYCICDSNVNEDIVSFWNHRWKSSKDFMPFQYAVQMIIFEKIAAKYTPMYMYVVFAVSCLNGEVSLYLFFSRKTRELTFQFGVGFSLARRLDFYPPPVSMSFIQLY